MNVNEIISKNIVKLRREVGISQLELSQALGVSPQAVSKWERALCCPDIALLPALAAALHVDIGDIFRNNEENR